MTDQNFQQIIDDFESMQSRYQQALQDRANAEANEEAARQAYFAQQQHNYEEGEKRDRRCTTVQKLIDNLNQIVQELEWGDTFRLNEKLQIVNQNMDFQLRNRLLQEGK